jgi:hypothetical protein
MPAFSQLLGDTASFQKLLEAAQSGANGLPVMDAHP